MQCVKSDQLHCWNVTKVNLPQHLYLALHHSLVALAGITLPSINQLFNLGACNSVRNKSAVGKTQHLTDSTDLGHTSDSPGIQCLN